MSMRPRSVLFVIGVLPLTGIGFLASIVVTALIAGWDLGTNFAQWAIRG